MPSSVAYSPPTLRRILTAGSFLYLLNVAGSIMDSVLHAGLVVQIVLGMVYGPPLGDIILPQWITSFIDLGYVGLILIVFEGASFLDFHLGLCD